MRRGHLQAGLGEDDESQSSSGLWSTAKILVSNYQILHHLPDVLAKSFPPAVQAFVSQLAPFNVEIFQAFDFRCSIPGGLYFRFVRTMLLPLLGVGVLALFGRFERIWLGHARASGNDTNRFRIFAG